MSEFVLIEERPSQGARHEVADGTTIGREACDITLADSEVSRSHARIHLRNGTLAVEDLQSTNGTRVNGTRLHAPAVLGDGDVIEVGNSALRVEAVRDLGATRPVDMPVAAAGATVVGEARGDVPAPEPASASRVHQALPAVTAPPQADFRPGQGSTGRQGRRSAATRTEATIVSYGVVLTTAAAIAVYLAQR
jgi:predicted component of type VI protein secretion system